jgi:hypothetical protein
MAATAADATESVDLSVDLPEDEPLEDESPEGEF